MTFVKIGGMKYSIKEKAELYEDDLKLEGLIDYRDLTICLEKNNKVNTKDMVLVHEIMHGLITNSVNRDLGSDENFILALSHGIYALLRDNPKLFDEIIHRKI